MSTQTHHTQLPIESKKLPLTIISLEEWSLIKLTGPDTIKYLQNQFTCDMHTITENKYNFTAYCNPKGKIISSIYVFFLQKIYIACIQLLSICKKQIEIMKKYAIFHNTTIIHDNKLILFGIAGLQARYHLNNIFNKLPNETNNIVHYKDCTLLHFSLPQERFLIIAHSTVLEQISNKLKKIALFSNSEQWKLLDIESGYPLIDYNTSEKFIPQAANIHLLGGISFNKGCYIGQEIVTRTTFRGKNKHQLYWLSSNINELPKSGYQINYKINNNWKPIGIVLAACKLQNNIWIQAILNKTFEKKMHIELKINNLNENNKINIISYFLINN